MPYPVSSVVGRGSTEAHKCCSFCVCLIKNTTARTRNDIIFFRYCLNKNFCLGMALHSMHMSIKTNFKTRFNRQRDRAEKGGRVAEWLARWTCDSETWSSSPALITSWICSRLSHVQILGHTCKIANWFASYQ